MVESKQSRAAEFLRFYKRPATLSFYGIVLRKFFRRVYGEGDFHEQSDRYFSEDRDYGQDIIDFYSVIEDMARASIKSHLSVIKTLFSDNDIEVPTKVWRKLRRLSRSARASHQDHVPTTEELRRMLSHMSIQGKALCLLMASAGTRIGETLQIKLDDVDRKSYPGRVQLRAEYTKGNKARVVFFSREATENIDEWIKNRERYFTTRRTRVLRREVTEPDDRLFPFSYTTAIVMWRTAIRKAGLDDRVPGSNRYKVHPHVLRKYFRTKLGAVIPVDVVNELMGHAGYLTNAYRRYSTEELSKFYLKGEPALLVFADNTDLLQLRDEVDGQRQYQQDLMTENFNNRNRLQSLEHKFNTLVSFVEQFKYDADLSLSFYEGDEDLDIERFADELVKLDKIDDSVE